jgi:hypothetical protein
VPAPGVAAEVEEPRPDAGRRRHRPDRETVRAAARQALGRAGDHLPSQAALRRRLLPILRDQDPSFVLGGRRMRALLLGAPGLRLRVRYRESERQVPLSECPVCGGEIRPIVNQTLDGDRVVLGYRCSRCAYWTHRKRRIPVRYTFSRSGRGRPRADPD